MKIASEGGTGIALNAMKRHQRSGTVQEMGCGAIYHLAKNYDGRVQIADEGGGKIVLTALREYPDNTNIQTNWHSALRRIWSPSDRSI